MDADRSGYLIIPVLIAVELDQEQTKKPKLSSTTWTEMTAAL